MININYQYNHNSTLLKLEGLPDTSLGQGAEIIGILSKWELQLLGYPLLEGKRIHLESLMTVILQYARYNLSGLDKQCSDSNDFIVINPQDDHHRILLKSTQQDTKPLEILIDDAGLADLVRCLDDLRSDSKVQIKWDILVNKPLGRRDLPGKTLKLDRYLAPLTGILSILILSITYLNMPTPPTKNYYESPSSTNTNNS